MEAGRLGSTLTYGLRKSQIEIPCLLSIATSQTNLPEKNEPSKNSNNKNSPTTMKWHDPFNKCKRGRKWPIMPRQLLILMYYKEGLGTREIAKRMKITRHTLYQHLKRIYAKLEVHNIKDAIERVV